MTDNSETQYFPHQTLKYMLRTGIATLLLTFISGTSSGEIFAPSSNTDLTALSLEELMSVEVTSVSKKKQKLSDSAAAIFVITQEDIRRSGMTTIPEILRIVPGLHVARLTGNKWAITARGDNGQFSNKLLVLIDGRSVYTPLFAGVYWDVQDTMLEDIDRIEIIRGPGGTLWGANAVNGIINIVTKQADKTQGMLLTASGGNIERGTGSIRYGGKIGEDLAFRIYGKYFNRENFLLPDGRSAHDDWHQSRLGFRADWQASTDNNLTVHGDFYNGRAQQDISTTRLVPAGSLVVNDNAKLRGGHFLTRWTHTFSSSSDTSLQFYYDRTSRREATIEIKRDTLDLDFQHKLQVGSYHDVVWGLGYRWSQDRIDNTFTVAFDPDQFALKIANGFIQDEVALIPNQLIATVGTKVSYNNYTDFEWQPNLRLLWKPHHQHTVWGAVSRAVRLPSRMEQNGRANVAAASGFGGTSVISLINNSDFKSEEVLAYELGYRTVPIPSVSVDIAGFYNVYRRLLSTETQPVFVETTPSPPHAVIPNKFNNRLNGNSYGVEVAAQWKVQQDWNLSLNYTWLRFRLKPDASSSNTTASNATGNNPKHQFQIRSRHNLPFDLEFDTGFYFASRLSNLGVPSYTRTDVRLGWKPSPYIEVSLVGQNLFDNQHPEFSGSSGVGGASIGGTSPSEVPRSGYLKLTMRF